MQKTPIKTEKKDLESTRSSGAGDWGSGNEKKNGGGRKETLRSKKKKKKKKKKKNKKYRGPLPLEIGRLKQKGQQKG